MEAKSLIGGLLAGAAIGVAIGILLAPRSGKETRENLANEADKLTDSLKKSVSNSVDSIKGIFHSKLDEAVRMGKEAVGNANDLVKR